MSKDHFEMMLRSGGLVVPPLEIRVVAGELSNGPDALVDVAWRGRSCRFVAELRRDAKPLTLKMAAARIGEYATAGQTRPMIIAPYFTSKKLNELLGAGISAIDFSGNAAIEVPGEFFFYKTGNPNRYPDSSPIRSAYRGDGSLVARVLLLERRFEAVSDILTSIKTRGGALTLGMVSKVIKRLEEDLVIERPTRNIVRVIQPERLLEGLLEAYQAPKAQRIWTGKVTLPNVELLTRLEEVAGAGNLVRTGEASAGDYAAWAGEPLITCYCRATPTALLERIGGEARETRAFSNLRLIQTQSQLVYFDARPHLASSPIQSLLEMADGDKRQREVAERIRNTILGAPGDTT